MSIGKKTAQGVFWNYVSYGAGKVLTFVSTIILTRLIAPEYYGQVMLALIVLTYFDAIGDLGIAAALIYQKDNVKRAANVAFLISIAMGFVLWGGAALGAPLLGTYFGDPTIVPMLRVLGVTFVIQSLGNVHNALLSKELNFRRKLVPDLTRTFAKGFVGIVLALFGFGAWSLVWGQVVGVVGTTVALWIVQPWRPEWLWDTALGKTMLKYGLQTINIELLGVLWSNADYLAVGKRLGSTDLALYRQAFVITDLLIVSMCMVSGRVLFPSYAKLNKDPQAIKKGFLITLRYISLITLPLSAGLIAIAPLFVNVLLTNEWTRMTPALQWLALRAGLSTLAFNSGHIFRAIGRPGIVSRQMAIKLTVLVIVVLSTVSYGFVGVAIGQVGVAIFGVLLDLGTVHRVIKVSVGEIWGHIQSALLAATGMGAIVWLFVSVSPQVWPILGLVSAICLGAVVYVGLLWFLERHLLLNMIRTVMQAFRADRPVVVEQ